MPRGTAANRQALDLREAGDSNTTAIQTVVLNHDATLAVYAASHIQKYTPCHVLVLGPSPAGLDTALQFASAEPRIVVASASRDLAFLLGMFRVTMLVHGRDTKSKGLGAVCTVRNHTNGSQ